jgi:hypothetical protein
MGENQEVNPNRNKAIDMYLASNSKSKNIMESQINKEKCTSSTRKGGDKNHEPGLN